MQQSTHGQAFRWVINRMEGRLFFPSELAEISNEALRGG